MTIKIPIGQDKELEVYGSDTLGVMKWKGEYIRIFKHPYTELDMSGFNPHEVIVRCEKCNYKVKTELLQAKCGMCHSVLIRVV